MARTAGVVAIGCVLAGLSMPGLSQNADAVALVEFQKRVDAYIELRQDVSRRLPKARETDDPSKIAGREDALSQGVIAARGAAKTGEVFGSAGPILARVVAADWKARSAADRRALFEEVPAHAPLRVNRTYPAGVPLVSVPAILLAKLPKLPQELEYRLLDRALLIHDRDANLVVDLVPEVLPRGTP